MALFRRPQGRRFHRIAFGDFGVLPSIKALRISRHLEGLHRDGIGVFGGGEHREECSDFAGALGGVAGGADDGDVSGAGIGDEDEVAFAGEGEGVGAVSDLDHVDALAVVDGVDADGVRVEVLSSGRSR